MTRGEVRSFGRSLSLVCALVLLSCLADPLDTPETIVEGVSTRASVAVGTLSGNFSVSADGAATYSIPIAVPKGRSGMEPSISINYSSQGGNGLLGVGWSLSAGSSQIARCGSNMRRDGAVRPVQFGAQDDFCLDGARLVQVGTITIPECTGSSLEYRTVPDSFSRVVACGPVDGAGPLRWVVYAKSGRILQYGDTAQERLEGTVPIPDPRYGTPTSSTILRRLAWLVSREKDRVGNQMTYTYWRDPSLAASKIGSLLSRIDYTYFYSSQVTPANRIVEFRYETRPDSRQSFVHGVEVVSNKRLVRIIAHGPTDGESWPSSPAETSFFPVAITSPSVRRYELAYETSTLTGRSRLKQVKTCDPFNVCLPPTVFSYSDASPTFTESDQGAIWATATPLRFIDFDGDGRDDLLYSDASNYWLRRSSGTSFGAAVVTQLADALGDVWDDEFAPGPLVAFDRTGDGGVDLTREVCTEPHSEPGGPNHPPIRWCAKSRLKAYAWSVDRTTDGVFHGHVRTWEQLRPVDRAILQREFGVSRNGKVPDALRD